MTKSIVRISKVLRIWQKVILSALACDMADIKHDHNIYWPLSVKTVCTLKDLVLLPSQDWRDISFIAPQHELNTRIQTNKPTLRLCHMM